MKRTRIEIIAEILDLCRKPRTKTRLLQSINLSWQQCNSILDNILSLGLLEIHHSQTKYFTTLKGTRFLDKWKTVAETIHALRIYTLKSIL